MFSFVCYMIEPSESHAQTELDAIDSIVLSNYDT